MQYDARPKEANDESALLTTSSMQISGAYCHNYGQWEHEDSVNYALSIFQVACDVYIVFRISDLY